MKKLLTFALTLFASAVMAEELTFNDPALWQTDEAGKNVAIQDGVITMDTWMLTCTQPVTIDPEGMYTLSMLAKSLTNGPAWLMAGFNAYDKNGRLIAVVNDVSKADTFTQVVENAPKGSMSFKVKDASKWNKDMFGRFSLAVNAKEDFSDLPNYYVEFISIDNVKQDGDIWVVSLKKPLPCDLRAESGVRQHYEGGAFYVMNFNGEADKWVAAEGYNEGICTQGSAKHKFPTGTATVRIVICNPHKTKCQIKELKLESE